MFAGTLATCSQKAGAIEMVAIPGGTFTMGSPAVEEGRDNDELQHQVTVSSFKMGKYEVTQAEYYEVMGVNPSRFKGSGYTPAGTEVQGRRPVENVSWLDAVKFCNALSEKEGRTKAYTINGDTVTMNSGANGYRLPTEAEWEYACRAGTATTWSFGNDASAAGDYAWTGENSNEMTHQVGLKKANQWGLYDMYGNVFELCWDLYGDYTGEAQTDPNGVASGSRRVIRGGSWYYPSAYSRSAFRNYFSSGYLDNLGFRVVCP